MSARKKTRLFLSSAQVADSLGVSQRTICLWAEVGEIPAFKLGRQWRFREQEISQWLDAMSDHSSNVSSAATVPPERRTETVCGLSQDSRQ